MFFLFLHRRLWRSGGFSLHRLTNFNFRKKIKRTIAQKFHKYSCLPPFLLIFKHCIISINAFSFEVFGSVPRDRQEFVDLSVDLNRYPRATRSNVLKSVSSRASSYVAACDYFEWSLRRQFVGIYTFSGTFNKLILDRFYQGQLSLFLCKLLR